MVEGPPSDGPGIRVSKLMGSLPSPLPLPSPAHRMLCVSFFSSFFPRGFLKINVLHSPLFSCSLSPPLPPPGSLLLYLARPRTPQVYTAARRPSNATLLTLPSPA